MHCEINLPVINLKKNDESCNIINAKNELLSWFNSRTINLKIDKHIELVKKKIQKTKIPILKYITNLFILKESASYELWLHLCSVDIFIDFGDNELMNIYYNDDNATATNKIIYKKGLLGDGLELKNARYNFNINNVIEIACD